MASPNPAPPAAARTQGLQSLGSPTPEAPALPAPPPLPALSPQDRQLLSRLFALNENYQTLAAELAVSTHDRALVDRLSAQTAAREGLAVPCPLSPVPSDLLDLYAWSTQPRIAAWLSYHHSIKDTTLRASALAALESLIKSPENKLEQRRAATTLLRALDHRWSAPPPNPKSAIQNPKSPRPLTPSITPDPRHSPQDLAAAIASDLRHEFSCQVVSTIFAILAPHAPIADEDLLQSRLDDVPSFSGPAHISDPIPFTPRDISTHIFTDAQELSITDPPTNAKLTLRFVRSPNHPWRLFDLNTG